jgi:hypothetical protein
MPVTTHFPGPPDTRMPENPGGIDELGIRYEGPVLTGHLGVRQAFRDQAGKLCDPRESNLPYLGPGVQAGPVSFQPQPANAADALVSVDPVVAAYRSRFGPPPSTHYSSPEQYDAVLRSHLNMGPAPDPYEHQRRREARRQSKVE